MFSPRPLVGAIPGLAACDGTGRDVTDTEELTQIVRECVRNEIALQQSGSSTSLFIENSRPYSEFCTICEPRDDKFHLPKHRSIFCRHCHPGSVCMFIASI